MRATRWCLCSILLAGCARSAPGRDLVVGAGSAATTSTVGVSAPPRAAPLGDVNVVPSPGTDKTLPVVRIDSTKPDGITRAELRNRQGIDASGRQVLRLEIKRSPLRGLLAALDPKTIRYGLDLDTPVFVVARGGNVRATRILDHPNVGWDLTAFDPKSGEEMWYQASVAPQPEWPSAFDALADATDPA